MVNWRRGALVYVHSAICETLWCGGSSMDIAIGGDRRGTSDIVICQLEDSGGIQ